MSSWDLVKTIAKSRYAVTTTVVYLFVSASIHEKQQLTEKNSVRVLHPSQIQDCSVLLLNKLEVQCGGGFSS